MHAYIYLSVAVWAFTLALAVCSLSALPPPQVLVLSHIMGSCMPARRQPPVVYRDNTPVVVPRAPRWLYVEVAKGEISPQASCTGVVYFKWQELGKTFGGIGRGYRRILYKKFPMMLEHHGKTYYKSLPPSCTPESFPLRRPSGPSTKQLVTLLKSGW